MGEMRMRFGRTRLRSVIGEKRALITCPTPPEKPAALCAIARAGESLFCWFLLVSDGEPGAGADAGAGREPLRRAPGAGNRCTGTQRHPSGGSECCTPPGPRSSPRRTQIGYHGSIRHNPHFVPYCQWPVARGRDGGIPVRRSMPRGFYIAIELAGAELGIGTRVDPACAAGEQEEYFM